MSKKRKALTHEEIWDDSALIDSWNEALEEYNYYHSLHARGEKVEDVLRQAEEAEMAELNGARAPSSADVAEAYLEDGELDSEDAPVDSETRERIKKLEEQFTDEVPVDTAGAASHVQSVEKKPTLTEMLPSASVPQTVLTAVQDDALKNLMMAWYYAGYYTGLHEGQQRATRNAPKPNTRAGETANQGKE